MNDTIEKILTVNYNKRPSYDILFQDSFQALPQALEKLGIQNRKICIISDSTVAGIYMEELVSILNPCCRKVCSFVFPAGEEHKTLDTVRDAYTYLIQEKFDRKDLLIALGGGVVGDLCGYTAATYLRGVDFIQLPTTLLSQVDSSIGGKTGVDFDSYKNMVGAFYMPKLVYMNLSVLSTLSQRQFNSGMAEVMKYGLIRDEGFYNWLISNLYEISDKEPAVLHEMIYNCCTIKKTIVEKDPTEQGDRALLNLGHTIGHAIEKYMKFQLFHGECVALGCVAAAHISWKHQLLSMEEYYEIRDMFVPFELPISVQDLDMDRILELTKSDKKVEAGKIRFVLLKKIGKAVIDNSVTDEDIMEALKEINYTEID